VRASLRRVLNFGRRFHILCGKDQMRRRAFIGLLGGAALSMVAPRRLLAQQDRVRRIAVLSGLAENDPESRLRMTSFERGLRDLGWIKGRNLQVEYRWAGDGASLRDNVTQIVNLKPELILANSTPVATALQEQTRTVPVVFVQVTDPIGQGLAANLAKPGGNLTGLTNFEFSIGSKWIEILKDIVPRLERVAIVFNPDTAPFAEQFTRPITATAATFAMAPTVVAARDAAELERMISAFAQGSNGGLLVLPDVSTVNHRQEIIALAGRHRLPAIYPYRLFATSGGLVSYGSDIADVFRRAAWFVDRILRGSSPGNIPIEAPTKFELVINLKSAKALQVDVPQRLLALADDIIE
jgi:putative ABC transport system substrate-binding protein